MAGRLKFPAISFSPLEQLTERIFLAFVHRLKWCPHFFQQIAEAVALVNVFETTGAIRS
jgi:hypothetical protein